MVDVTKINAAVDAVLTQIATQAANPATTAEAAEILNAKSEALAYLSTAIDRIGTASSAVILTDTIAAFKTWLATYQSDFNSRLATTEGKLKAAVADAASLITASVATTNQTYDTAGRLTGWRETYTLSDATTVAYNYVATYAANGTVTTTRTLVTA